MANLTLSIEDDLLKQSRLAASPQRRKRTIEWNFTRQDADKKLGRHYVSKLAC